ncbi:hypothetical protein LCGC14_0714410 [marine sediment metagenome]|uniref:Polymerase nucleotidyl transferase domain-containing protein n=1 Tax=marine sediment metagenome TaxID=412755 RepID=A0A0F9QZK5_9ZZZZ
MRYNNVLREHFDTIIYSEREWLLLEEKRNSAYKLLEIFFNEGIYPFVYGSIARGNIHEDSDIDIIFLQEIPPFQIEYILNKNGYINYFREIIMATPSDSLKLYIYLSELESITLPLSKLDTNGTEFYNFSGIINLNQLKSGVRVVGIDKRLVLIKPNSQGHEEISIIGNEAIFAKEFNININVINERKRVLLRREKYGRTGVFLKEKIQMNETTEEVLKKLASRKSIVRKKLYKR